MSLILASQSPRRKQLLELLRVPFTVRVADIDETLDTHCPIPDAVARLSLRKAQAIPRDPEDTVIAADTIVVCDSYILGKPEDKESAFKMLAMLSGRTHQVMTGVTVLKGDRHISFTEITLTNVMGTSGMTTNADETANVVTDESGKVIGLDFGCLAGNVEGVDQAGFWGYTASKSKDCKSSAAETVGQPAYMMYMVRIEGGNLGDLRVDYAHN